MAKRNANGEGTIYKRKDGRFEAAAYFPTTSGVPKRVRFYGKTREAVRQKLTEAAASVQKGVPIPDRAWRVGEYLEYWLEEVVRPNKRPATFAQCEMVVRLYLRPGLGKLSLIRLSVPTVQVFLNKQLAEGHSVPKAQVLRKVLSSALTCAMREERVTRNVARLAVLPKHEPQAVEPWSVVEAREFLSVTQSSRLHPAYLLLLLYGLRRGEVLGLRWSDVDFAANVLHVRQQLQRVGRSLQPGPVKTRAGRRDLPLLKVLHVSLSMMYNSLIATKGKAWFDTERLIFSAENGGPMEPSRLVRSFHRICRQQNFRRIKLHALRHTSATLLKQLGVPVRDAQLILGHARVSTTQELYQHDTLQDRRTSLERMETALTLSPTNKLSDSARGRCRQRCRQSPSFIVNFIRSISGAGDETLTRGLILGKSVRAGGENYLTEAKAAARRFTRQWLLGCVAVNYCRQNSGPSAPGAEASP